MYVSGFHLGFRQGGGGKHDNCSIMGGRTLIILKRFLSAKNDVVLINLLILGGLGACSPRKFFLFFNP
jgi:hypothetical protein